MSKSKHEEYSSDINSGENNAATSIEVKMNVYPVHTQLDWVFEHRVEITPVIENDLDRQKALETCIAENQLGPFVISQNQVLLQQNCDGMHLKVSMRGQTYSLEFQLIEQKKLRIQEQTQNELLNMVFQKIGLHAIGRNYYWIDPTKAIPIPESNSLEIEQGFTSAIHLNHPSDESLMDQNGDSNSNLPQSFLELDLASKVVHVLSIYQEIQQWESEGESHEKISRKLIGRSFFTSHNHRVYEIEEVNWSIHPDSTFTWHHPKIQAEEISYTDYYIKKYGVDLQASDQPFLKCAAKNRSAGNTPLTAAYIPCEIAYLANLSDEEREDTRVMQYLTKTTQYSPQTRQSTISEFLQGPELNNHLASWGMHVDDSMLATDALQFPAVAVDLQSRIIQGPNWQHDLNHSHILLPLALTRWAILYEKGGKINPEDIKSLISDMIKFGRDIGMTIESPLVHAVPNLATFLNTYNGTEQGILVQFVLSITSGKSKQMYRSIKQRFLEQLGIPSQHMCLKSIRNFKRRTPVIVNILRQINQKAFASPRLNDFSTGALWQIHQSSLPKDSLLVGIDVCHGRSGISSSIAGITMSFDGGIHYTSKPVLLHRIGQELIPQVGGILKQCLKEYHSANAHYPRDIFILRDGVGNTQQAQLLEQEYASICAGFEIAEDQQPRIAIISANKRVHRRIFIGDSGSLTNPHPGTYVTGIGNGEVMNNFYLVSHETRQGSLTPTHYTVLYNTTALTAEQLGSIAFELTHMYYNWPGGIRTPAPIQCAHKLAFLMNQARLKSIHERLRQTQFFL